MRRDPLIDLWKTAGVHFEGATTVMPASWKTGNGYALAMDAQPTAITSPNSGIPAFLTTSIDPDIVRVVLTPNQAAEIFGEVKKGNWLSETEIFIMVERTGEVSSYGDYSNNGSAGINTQFPQRQAYLYQTTWRYGEREMERAGLARIGYAAEVQEAGAVVLNKFQNLTYFFGVAGLQNYGLLNDPSLSASLTPAPKAAGGNTWIKNGAINATANEIYADIQALFFQLISQTNGVINQKDAMTLAMSPGSEVAMTATNTFNVNVSDLLKKNFPNMEIKTAVQYGQTSASNPQGITAGNFVQLIAKKLDGQETGYCAFNEKLRTHPIIRAMSSFQQKATQGTWGAVIRIPAAISSMIGV